MGCHRGFLAQSSRSDVSKALPLLAVFRTARPSMVPQFGTPANTGRNCGFDVSACLRRIWKQEGAERARWEPCLARWDDAGLALNLEGLSKDLSMPSAEASEVCFVSSDRWNHRLFPRSPLEGDGEGPGQQNCKLSDWSIAGICCKMIG